MNEFQRVTATLAFKITTECATYKVLFEPKQWDYLVDQFKQEFCQLYGMTLEPLLNIYLQAGLSALKTPYPNFSDLFADTVMKMIAPKRIPCHRRASGSWHCLCRHHSKLVCYITKELMDTENPPQVLPNGYVYSTQALKEMANRSNGKITCPRTGYVCKYTELVKAYVSQISTLRRNGEI